MKHYAAPDFWASYRDLPAEVQRLADKSFELLKADPHHPSIHFKKVDRFWSARVGLDYRALAIHVSDGVLWFWIGTRRVRHYHWLDIELKATSTYPK